jgi:hypothetical protein
LLIELANVAWKFYICAPVSLPKQETPIYICKFYIWAPVSFEETDACALALLLFTCDGFNVVKRGRR